MSCEVWAVEIEESSVVSQWEEGAGFCCSDVEVVVVLVEVVDDVLDCVSRVLCENRGYVLK